jgi:predicted AlkP superfamily phosphohydrolase/phosphomutase
VDGWAAVLYVLNLIKTFVACLFVVSIGCSSGKRWPLVIVLGIDGMDPKYVERHLADLPNLRKLMEQGEFKRLETTMPPQSPVAWSTFSTGLDPSQHGLFDFVYRDPATGKPFSAMGEMEEPKYRLNLGGYSLPLGSPRIKTFRKGTVFWKLLAEAGVPAKILRMPVNYPPAESKAIALSAMGVPDMRGTFGTFTFFTDDPSEARHAVAGGDIEKIQLTGDRAMLKVVGPTDPFRGVPTSIKIKVDVDPFENVARFSVQDQTIILRGEEWSEWIPVQFPDARGMIRIYAKGFRPDFEVYVSPVNFNPLHADAAISAPASESARIASSIGLFYTQGMAEDTSAYRHNVFNRQEYLAQARLVADEQMKLLKQELHGFNSGFFFLHFSGVDQNSHMLWGKFEDELLATYKLVDENIGWVMREHPGATIIVMSDHGFSSFDRAVNLNAWPEINKSAYALGLNAVYLRLAGREHNGTVPRAAAASTLRDVERKLLALRDPVNGKQVIARVWSPHPGFEGDIQMIPDLIAGYEPGYRSSWEGSLGSNAGPVITDNTDAWIGDHCIAPEFVPGVLISNRKSTLADPSLKDLTASILSLYRVKPADGMNGKVIY